MPKGLSALTRRMKPLFERLESPQAAGVLYAQYQTGLNNSEIVTDCSLKRPATTEKRQASIYTYHISFTASSLGPCALSMPV